MTSISIIVPIYGVEDCIERCVRSLFEQSFEDIEFIFVNDATTDASMDILYRVYSEYPERNVVILNHPVNMGLPKARETGLAAAKGTYIAFCDSDDWLEKDYCKELYNAAKASDADIAACRYRMADDAKVYCEGDDSDYIWYEKSDILSSTISWEASPFLWKKLFRRDLFDNYIVHPSHFHGEDWVLMVQLAFYAKKTTFVDRTLYNYNFSTFNSHRLRLKEDSIKRCHDIEENVKLVCEWLSEIGIKNKYKSELVKAKSFAKKQLVGQADKECRHLWINTFPEINFSLLFNRYIKVDYKVIHLAVFFNIYSVSKHVKRYLTGFFRGHSADNNRQ